MDKEAYNPEFCPKTWTELIKEEMEREFQMEEKRRRKLLKLKQAELEEDLEDGMDSA